MLVVALVLVLVVVLAVVVVVVVVMGGGGRVGHHPVGDGRSNSDFISSFAPTTPPMGCSRKREVNTLTDSHQTPQTQTRFTALPY